MNEENLYENDYDIFDSDDITDVGSEYSDNVAESESDDCSDYDSSDIYDSDSYTISATQEDAEIVAQLEKISNTLSMFFVAFMCTFIIKCVHKMFFG